VLFAAMLSSNHSGAIAMPLCAGARQWLVAARVLVSFTLVLFGDGAAPRPDGFTGGLIAFLGVLKGLMTLVVLRVTVGSFAFCSFGV